MTKIEILSAPGCSKCEEAKQKIERLLENFKADFSDVQVETIDVTEHPEAAIKYRVLSTPAIAIDGKLEFTGVPKEEALMRKLKGDR